MSRPGILAAQQLSGGLSLSPVLSSMGTASPTPSWKAPWMESQTGQTGTGAAPEGPIPPEPVPVSLEVAGDTLGGLQVTESLLGAHRKLKSNPSDRKEEREERNGIRYKEEFEKNKGKGFSVVADTPELQRIRKTQDQISNEFERSRMGPSPSEGSEPERRNSQESSGYRRAEAQPQQQLGQPGAT
ncbi:LIM and SH3 domain protein 1, partial [Lamprotornis superbus]